MRIRVAPAAWLLAVLLLAGAASPPLVLAREPARPDIVRLALRPYPSFAPFAFAMEDGFFAEQNIEIQVADVQKTSAAIVLLGKGELDVAAGSIEIAALNAMARGARIAVVADKGHFGDGTGSCTTSALIARNELLDQGVLRTVPDMKGRSVCFYTSHPDGWFIDTLLRRHGLTMNDLNIKSLGNPLRVAALSAGTLDIAMGIEPAISQMRSLGVTRVWIDIEKEFPGTQYAVVYYGPRFLEDRDLGTRFMVAYLKGVRRYNEGLTPRNVESIARLTTLTPETIRGFCMQLMRPDGDINGDSILAFQEWALRQGYLEKIIPVDRFFDRSFIEAAGKVLGASVP